MLIFQYIIFRSDHYTIIWINLLYSTQPYSTLFYKTQFPMILVPHSSQ